jgi:hypothetical protein
MMTRILVATLLIASPVSAGDDETEFPLDLADMQFRPRDQRTEARIARWNSDPMARVAMHMNSEQARILGGNRPGTSRPNAMVFSMRLQKGLAAALMVSTTGAGVTFNERRFATIRWPWEKDDSAKPAMPLDEQLTIMLGDRLESR